MELLGRREHYIVGSDGKILPFSEKYKFLEINKREFADDVEPEKVVEFHCIGLIPTSFFSHDYLMVNSYFYSLDRGKIGEINIEKMLSKESKKSKRKVKKTIDPMIDTIKSMNINKDLRDIYALCLEHLK